MSKVKINKGVTSETPLNQVPREEWEEVISWRRATATRQIPLDCRALLFYAQDGEDSCDWGGYNTRNAYLRDGLGIDPLTVDWAIEGLKIYKGDASKLSVQDAAELGRPSAIMAAAPTLAPNGTNRYSSSFDNIKPKNQGGTDPEYLAARIKRDYPEFVARIDEFSSIYAAAVFVGIIKLKSNLRKLQDLWKKTSNEEKDQFLKEIQAKVNESE